MTDDRIIDIFEQHGQFVTGKDYALIRTIAEAVAAQRTWIGLTDGERKDIERQSVYVEGAIRLTEAKLKEKNT